MFTHFDKIHERDGRTGGQRMTAYTALCIASRGEDQLKTLQLLCIN